MNNDGLRGSTPSSHTPGSTNVMVYGGGSMILRRGWEFGCQEEGVNYFLTNFCEKL